MDRRALLLVRLRGDARRAARRAAGGARDPWRGFLLASAGRRGAAINRGLRHRRLLLAFGVNLGIFTATYDQQARVDAQLTLGADVVAAAPPGRHRAHDLRGGSHGSRRRAAHRRRSLLRLRRTDLQDTFGIDAADAHARNDAARLVLPRRGRRATLARLRATPDGVLVSKETITDYRSARRPARLRVLDHAHRPLRVVPFHVAGVVQEFPSAPRTRSSSPTSPTCSA